LILLALTILGIGGYLIYTKGFQTSVFQNVETANVGSNLEAQDMAQIDIKNFSYSPSTVKIKTGGKVTWLNSDSMRHNAAADDNSWQVELMNEGESQSIKFDKPGTYTYHCSPHPWMKGTIIVE